MAEPRFTPGPWFIGPDYVDDEGHREIAIQAANGLGGVCTPASVVLQFPKHEGMQEANARLVAAAPEIYDALRRLIPPEQEAHMEETPGDFHEDWHKARAALAKARGE